MWPAPHTHQDSHSEDFLVKVRLPAGSFKEVTHSFPWELPVWLLLFPMKAAAASGCNCKGEDGVGEVTTPAKELRLQSRCEEPGSS